MISDCVDTGAVVRMEEAGLLAVGLCKPAWLSRDLVQLFDDAPDVTMVAISVLDSSDHAVVRMIFDNADAARHLLRRNKFTFSELELLVLELDDEHTLTHACLFLLGAELNIRFAYPIMPGIEHGPLQLLALAVDDNTFAGQILCRKGFRLMAEDELA